MSLPRSAQMARIRGRDTSPEVTLGEALRRTGVAIESQPRTAGGRADFLVRDTRPVAVFVDGCFWHGCPEHYTRPGSRETFWSSKLSTTVERDRRQGVLLHAAGVEVVRVWEHEVALDLGNVVARIVLVARGICHEPGPSWRVFRVEELNKEERLERRYLVSLSDPEIHSIVECRRDTRKWRRTPPSPMAQALSSR